MSEITLRAKILMIGDGGVGKSAFRRAWLGETFRSQYFMTIGADFASKEISFFDPPTNTTYTVKFQIWDLAGQPRFKVVSELYYRGAVGALCFFDITNLESYLNLVNWINSYWKLNGDGQRPLLIVGAKCDLRKYSNFKHVPEKHGIEYARELTKLVKKENDFTIHYIETSAKENINVDKTFRVLSAEIVKVYNQIMKSVLR
ncbi:MAG: Rab family GTPase [Promethearchaeota archaeon]